MDSDRVAMDDSSAAMASDSSEAHAELAQTLFNEADRLRAAGKQDEALATMTECTKILKTLHRSRPIACEGALLAALSELSTLLRDPGRHQDTLATLEEIVQMCKNLDRLRPAEWRETLQKVVQLRSIVLEAVFNNDDAFAVAIRTAGDALKIDTESRVARKHFALATALFRQLFMISDGGKKAEILAVFGEIIQTFRALYHLHLTDYEDEVRDCLAKALSQYAQNLIGVGAEDKALAALEESVQLYTEMLQAHPTDGRYLMGLISDFILHSGLLYNAGRHEDALAAIERLSTLTSNFQFDPPTSLTS